MAKMLPLTVVCMGLAAVAATGLPPFGLFFSEMTVLNGGFAAGHTAISTLVLVALLASFCGILYQLTRILLGVPKVQRTSDAMPLDGVPAMGLMLATLLVFSLWQPGAVARRNAPGCRNHWRRAMSRVGSCHVRNLQPAICNTHFSIMPEATSSVKGRSPAWC